jgi:hypothetical protein
MDAPIFIINNADGGQIAQTNFFELHDKSSQFKFICSVHAHTFRILLPEWVASAVDDTQAADSVVITRGRWQLNNRVPIALVHGEDALEFLFEDHTQSPYVMHTGMEACLGGLPSRHDEGRTDLRCLVYVASSFPRPAIDLPAAYRRAARIPCMKPLSPDRN